MNFYKLLRGASLSVLAYKFYMFGTYRAGIETWHIFAAVLHFNALLYYIEAFRKEK